jgi:predicted amidohydrolase YtcJ
MLDGVIENHTAAMLAPYLDPNDSEKTGIDFIDPELLKEAVSRLDGLGLQCHFHAIGDRAVRLALDAVEAARRANGWNDLRHHIAHIQLIHPEDVPRFRRLGVVANAQPLWATHHPEMDELTIPFLGEERSGWQYPFRSLLGAGATLAMGSDWPVSTAEVMAEIEVAVNRVAPETRHRAPFLSDERLTLADALTAFTAGSAFVNHLDDTGTIASGMRADLVMLDRNPFEDHPIGEARVAMTIVGGNVVYEA